MEPGQLVQVSISAVVILGAAAAALLCDRLKSENDRLRQANLDLLARRNEERHRGKLIRGELRRANRVSRKAAVPASAGRDPGDTLEEARDLARELLAVAARQQRAERAGPAETELKTNWDAAAPTGGAPHTTPRKNWGQLLRTAGSAIEPQAAAPMPAAKAKGELIPFESLQNHQDAAARFGGR